MRCKEKLISKLILASWQSETKEWLYLGALWTFSRLAVFLIATSTQFMHSIRLVPEAAIHLHHISSNPVLDGLARWDTNWYLDIVQNGYLGGMFPANTCFFPLYPLFVRLIARSLSIEPLLAGILISNLTFAVALGYLYRLLKLCNSSSDTALRTCFYVAIFPLSFFYSSMYAESFLLLFSVAAFYYSKQQLWWISSVFVALALATKINALALIPALLVEYLEQCRFRLNNIHWDFLAFLLMPLGLLAYMGYLGLATGDPLLFVHAFQTAPNEWPSWHRQLSLPWTTLWHYVRMLFAGVISSQDIFELVTVIFFFVGSIFVAITKRWSETIFCLSGVLLTTMTGHLGSAPRYLLFLFPVYWVLAERGCHPVIDLAVKMLWLSLLGMFTMRFSLGLWVA